jgi:hypothetical protein
MRRQACLRTVQRVWWAGQSTVYGPTGAIVATADPAEPLWKEQIVCVPLEYGQVRFSTLRTATSRSRSCPSPGADVAKGKSCTGTRRFRRSAVRPRMADWTGLHAQSGRKARLTPIIGRMARAGRCAVGQASDRERRCHSCALKFQADTHDLGFRYKNGRPRHWPLLLVGDRGTRASSDEATRCPAGSTRLGTAPGTLAIASPGRVAVHARAGPRAGTVLTSTCQCGRWHSASGHCHCQPRLRPRGVFRSVPLGRPARAWEGARRPPRRAVSPSLSQAATEPASSRAR